MAERYRSDSLCEATVPAFLYKFSSSSRYLAGDCAFDYGGRRPASGYGEEAHAIASGMGSRMLFLFNSVVIELVMVIEPPLLGIGSGLIDVLLERIWSHIDSFCNSSAKAVSYTALSAAFFFISLRRSAAATSGLR